MKVSKNDKVECYQVYNNNGSVAANIYLLYNCEERTVNVTMDAYNQLYYGNKWNVGSSNPKEILANIEFHRCMTHLTGKPPFVPDPDRYQDEVKARILEALDEESITEEEAEQALKEMASIVPDELYLDDYFLQLSEHELYYKIFQGDPEYLPRAEKPDLRLRAIWDHIWVPFQDQLNAELESVAA